MPPMIPIYLRMPLRAPSPMTQKKQGSEQEAKMGEQGGRYRHQRGEQGAMVGVRGGRHLLIGIWPADQRRGRQPREGGTSNATKSAKGGGIPKPPNALKGGRRSKGRFPGSDEGSNEP